MGLPENFRRQWLLRAARRPDAAARGHRRRGGAGRVLLGGTLEQVAAMAARRAGPARPRNPGRLGREWGPAEAVRLGDRAAGRWAGADLCQWHPGRGRGGAGRLGRERAGSWSRGLSESPRGWSPRASGGWWSPAGRRAGRGPGAGRKGAGDRADDRSGRAGDGLDRRDPPLALALKSGNFGGPDFPVAPSASCLDRDPFPGLMTSRRSRSFRWRRNSRHGFAATAVSIQRLTGVRWDWIVIDGA